jgi:hypothetical protein
VPSHFSPSHPTSLTYPEEAHALFSSDSNPILSPNPILSRAASCATLQRENLTSALAREIFALCGLKIISGTAQRPVSV